MPLFRIDKNRAKRIKTKHFRREKELQSFVEQNLEEIFGIRFVDTEHYTGERHGGRIDTLGLDDNNNPVIIEYKGREEKNIINQGLFYLDWLVDHKGDFQVVAEKKLGSKQKIDWGQPRLILLATSYNRFDKHAVNTLAENIELWTYSVYENGIFEIQFEGGSQASSVKGRQVTKVAYEKYNLDYHLRKTKKDLSDKYSEIRERILELSDVSEHLDQKSGISYRTTKSFARFEFCKSFIRVLLRPPRCDDPRRLVKDVTTYRWGYRGMVKLLPSSDVSYIFGLVRQSYEDTI